MPLAVDAENPSAAAVEVAHDVSEVLFRHADLYRHDRFEQDRVGLHDALLERETRRKFEGHFRAVDVVVGSVEQRRAEINDGETRQGPLRQRLAQSLFDRGYELSRHGSAGNLVLELETGSAFERAEPDVNIPVLSVAAGLLLVLPLRLGDLPDRLPVRNLGRLGFKLDAVSFLDPREDDIEVHVPHSGEDAVSRLRVLFERKAGVLFEDLVNRIGELVFVRAALGDDSEAIDGFRELDRRVDDGRPLQGEGVAGVRALELRDRDDVADGDFLHVLAFLAGHGAEGADAFVLSPVHVEDIAFRGKRAGEDPDEGELADVRVYHDLETQGRKLILRVRGDHHILVSLLRSFRRGLERTREDINDEIHELLDADVQNGGSRYDGEDSAHGERLAVCGEQFLERNRLSVEIPHHQFVVRFDDDFDKTFPRGRRGVFHVVGNRRFGKLSAPVRLENIRFFAQQIDESLK